MRRRLRSLEVIIPFVLLFLVVAGFAGVAYGEAEDSAGAPPDSSPKKPTPTLNPTFGEFDPGHGFLVGRTDRGELTISAYGLLRYMNILPAGQKWTDRNGNEHEVLDRHDFFSHRIMVYFTGWAFDKRFRYQATLWTLTATDQRALFMNFGYQFHTAFNLWGGVGGNRGTRSIYGSHPYWLGNDRVMADEFFRPGFSMCVWADGQIAPGFFYSGMVGVNNSILGITAAKLDREFTYSGGLFIMPTTKEFGPRGGYGDFAWHEKVATRFGVNSVFSPEQRLSDPPNSPGNTALKLADGLNVFDTGALAEGVTVKTVDYVVMSLDAAMKYKGFFLHGEYYWRRINSFETYEGDVPYKQINDQGFHIQAAFFPIKQLLEVYGATSQIYGDKDAGFGNSSEYLAGLNFYPGDTRNVRVNVQFIDVNKSPVGSMFGYYSAGHNGQSVSVATMLFF